jgi:hypothetical protein
MVARSTTRLATGTWYQGIIDSARRGGAIVLIECEYSGFPLFQPRGGGETIGSKLVRRLLDEGWLVISARDEVLGNVTELTPVDKEAYVDQVIEQSLAGKASDEVRTTLLNMSEEELADVRKQVTRNAA